MGGAFVHISVNAAFLVSESKDPAMNLDWDEAEQNLAREEELLWKSELEVRLRCDGLTPLEKRGLRKCRMWEGNGNCLNDAEKAQFFFGLASGGTAACKRLLKHAFERAPCQHGGVVNFRDVQFTLGKHLLLSDRRQQQSKGPLPQHMTACKCFAATYVMPAGCQHVKQPLWKAAAVMRTTFCPTCSRCLRCQKLLVFYCLAHVALMLVLVR